MSTWDAEARDVTSTDAAGESDPDAISRQIDHTRQAMAGTLDEIQRRLEPEQVTNYVKDVAYYVVLELKGAVRELAGEAVTTVRTNAPKPAVSAPRLATPELPRVTDATRTFLARYTGKQPETGTGQMPGQTQGLWKKLEANPIALGAVGIAVGSIVGAIAPRLEKEDEIMGEARDRLMENVQATAGQTAESLRTAAAETGSAVLKEATSSQQTR